MQPSISRNRTTPAACAAFFILCGCATESPTLVPVPDANVVEIDGTGAQTSVSGMTVTAQAEAWRGADFHAELVDAETGEMFATVHIPFIANPEAATASRGLSD